MIRSVLAAACALSCAPSLSAAQDLAERHQLQGDAPIKGTASVLIDADASVVWSTFVAVDAWPRWNDDAPAAQLSGRFAAGTTLEYGGATRHHLTIGAVEPGRRAAIYGTYAGAVGVTLWSFETVSPGVTRVTASESNDGPLISVFYSERALTQHLTLWLTRLKAEVERTSPGRHSE
jgi:hypothetical protein